jgi:hypothetical protein
LDEVGINRDFVAAQIRHFCEFDEQQEHKNRVLVTCRENSYRTEDLRDVIPTIVKVEPFANHHMRIFLQGWPIYKGRSAIRLYGMIQQDPQIRDICRNPLLLTILAGIYLETDNFQLPKSRNRFYYSSIEELLINRPSRREIEQSFEMEDKLKILQRVCLESLMSANISDDPEEMSVDSISKISKDVLQKDVKIKDFIKELSEINGIIKPCGADTYTCVHRTIQEYFAAREALRSLTPYEVIALCGKRQDLNEIVFFYCGLLSNIPQLSIILQELIGTLQWLEAGRCLQNMTEIPAEALITQISEALLNLIVNRVTLDNSLEILSSLSQRTEPAFEATRRNFAEAIDYLSNSKDKGGLSALESVLSSSPETAMKCIPGLLEHKSVLWNNTAVKLLRDIGICQ